MQSLAMVVTVLALIDVVSSASAMVIAWRTRTLRGCFVAGIVGMPGAMVGIQFILAVQSLGAILFGGFGVLGFIVAVIRMLRLPRRGQPS